MADDDPLPPESRKEHRILFETMTQGVVYQDTTGYITSANSAAVRILGLSLDQMQGRTSMHPDWRAILPDGSPHPGENHPSMVALRTKRPVLNFIQGIFNPSTRKYVWMSVDSIPQFQDGEEAPYEVISIFSDITLQLEGRVALERTQRDMRSALEASARSRRALLSVIEDQKSTEEALRLAQAKLEDLVEAINNLSRARTLEEIQRITTSSARKLANCDGSTFVLMDSEYCWYVDEDAIAPLWKGQKFPLEQCISGWVMLNRTPAIIPDIYADTRIPSDLYRPTFVKSMLIVPINQANPIGAIGNYWRSQHAPNELETRLLLTLADAVAIAMENISLLTDLERRVRARTAELEASNKELESFSYSVSHDLRAPLRAIDGYVRILMEDFNATLGAEGMRVCSIISGSARKMGQLIDDLLTFSRTGKAIIEKSMIDMRAMVASLFGELVPESVRARIDFRVAELPPAFGDPALIRQVWSNLINNAVKFSSKVEHPVISIDAATRDGTAVYQISDNGAGFDMRYADKLFGVFQRLHSLTEFEGTGVGLAIVQRIIARHGGRIWAEAQLGHGAVFYFTLTEEANHGQP